MRWDPASKRLVQVGCCGPIETGPTGPQPPLEVDVVGVGTGANTLLYSGDGGLTWTGLGNSIFTSQGFAAAWNGTMWVAAGSGTNGLAYSYDGINWTGLGAITTGPASNSTYFTSVTWDGSAWTAFNGTDEYATSFDGIHWLGYNGITFAELLYNTSTDGRITVGTPSIPPTLLSLLGFAYIPRNVAVGAVSDANLTAEQILEYTDILWDESKFIITVGNRVVPNNSKFYSTDGRSWTGIPNVSYVDGTNIGRTTGGFYISRGTNPDATEKSTDGLTWTSATSPSLPIVQGGKGTIFGTDTRVFVCGFNNNSFEYTTDGTTWISGSTGLSGNFKGGFYKYVPALLNFEFVNVSGSLGVDPGSGNFSGIPVSFPTVVLQFNKTDANSIDAADFLQSLYYSTLLSAARIEKDSNNYSNFIINSSTDSGTYRSFNCTVTSFAGIVLPGDTVKLKYTTLTWAFTARDSARTWTDVTSSSDGTKLAAVVNGGQIYTSTDSGVSWTARESNRAWTGIASSSNGTNLVAVVNGGQIYTSTDSGVSWTARDSARAWVAVASSSNGTQLVAVVSGGQIYLSTDSGVSWTATESNRNWSDVTSSDTGTELAAVVSGGQVYVSTDSGVSWTATESNRNWSAVAFSGDGSRLGAVVNGGQIYISTDSGVSWTTAESNRNWSDIVFSNDGDLVAAVEYGGKIYTSIVFGLYLWIPQESNRNWNAIASSSDGRKIVASVDGGQLYTGLYS
jgi:ligand-binding sensor protein